MSAYINCNASLVCVVVPKGQAAQVPPGEAPSAPTAPTVGGGGLSVESVAKHTEELSPSWDSAAAKRTQGSLDTSSVSKVAVALVMC